MTRRAKIGVGVVFALIVAALGPVPRVDPVDAEAIAARVPEGGISDWLAASEAPFHDLTPGAGKGVVWAGAEGERTPLAIVYVHGFSATRMEISPVTEEVGRELGANVYFARLTGHGLPGERLAEATATDWMADTIEAIEVGKRLGERVVVVGTSTGASLVLAREANAHDAAVIGVVAISPNFGPRSAGAGLFLWPWLALALPPALGDREWEPANELQARYWTTKYPVSAIAPMMASVAHVQEAPLERFAVPTLWVWSDEDGVVDPALTEAAYARLPADLRDREEVTCAAGEECHVLAGDIVSPTRTSMVTAWIVERIRRWGA